jgi:hypothetical protein
MAKENFPFLSLPTEIRLVVYEHLFLVPVEGMLITITHPTIHHPYGSSSAKGSKRTRHEREPRMAFSRHPQKPVPRAVLLLSRLIYREALPVMYRDVTFFAPGTEMLLVFFLDRLSPLARSSIQHVQLSPGRLLRGSPTLGQASWGVICRELALLPGLRDVTVLYRSAAELHGESIAFHQQRYAQALRQIPAKKLLTFESKSDSHKGSEDYAYFQRLLADAEEKDSGTGTTLEE